MRFLFTVIDALPCSRPSRQPTKRRARRDVQELGVVITGNIQVDESRLITGRDMVVPDVLNETSSRSKTLSR